MQQVIREQVNSGNLISEPSPLSLQVIFPVSENEMQLPQGVEYYQWSVMM